MIKELRLIHTGDAGYSDEDLVDDLEDRCRRQGVEFDDKIVEKLLGKGADLDEGK